MELMLPKGVRDFLPEEKIERDEIVQELKKLFELYGFVPLETPAIERFEVLSSKFAGGEEILKETFKFKDQGERELGLRYDLTVPLARFVGMNSNLKMPFKRYQIEKVWRDGPITTGRYREFLQCDVDVVGITFMSAEAELLAIAAEFFEKMKFEFEIKVNNRKLLDGIMLDVGIREEYWSDFILSLDKLEKIGRKEVEKELEEKGFPKEKIEEVLEIIEKAGKEKENKKMLEVLEKSIKAEVGKEGIKELKELFEYCKAFGAKNLSFSPSLARGLGYYTGTIFEVLLKKGTIKSSIAGGGRYDEMIGKFAEKNKPFPAVGISFGMERIFDELKERKKETKKTNTKIFVVPVGSGVEREAIALTQKIRELGINADIDLMKRGISKNLEYASVQGIPFVVVLGENELKEKAFKLKDMKSGKETKIKIADLSKLKDKLK